MKRFLLIAGDNYYPESGTEDWIATFKTRAEAEAEVKINPSILGDPRSAGSIIRGIRYDWHEIVDLKEWTNEDDS